MRFRAATYNIHKCRGMDWRVRPDRIAAVLEEMDADIIALQEVREDQISCLSRTLRSAPVFGPARKLGQVDYGKCHLQPVRGNGDEKSRPERAWP
jgi:endonuclease/exonuclease/phosphatase family metal-dependent hydrolase